MGAWIYGGLALLIAVLGVATWGESQRIDTLKAEKDSLTTSLNQAKGDNAEQAKTIDTLTKDNGEWARKAKEGAEKQATAAQELATAKQARAVTKAQLAALEAKDRTSVSCEALLKTDLAAVCPNIAAAAQQRAQ